MPKALLLDFGGVITTPVRDSFAAFAHGEGFDPEVLWQAMRRAASAPDDPFTLIETGRIPLEEFDRRLSLILSAAVGKELSPERLKERLFAASAPDEHMVSAVRALRAARVPTAMVSNSWGGNYQGPGGYDGQLLDQLFDVLVISGEVGVRKPDAVIYRLAAGRLGVDPRDCIFVDDFQVNVDGARAVGMAAVHHVRAAQTIPALEEFLGVPLV